MKSKVNLVNGVGVRFKGSKLKPCHPSTAHFFFRPFILGNETAIIESR
jgi:hypothetical protein